MGRFSTSGARLHELRWRKPANAALCQDRPPRSHGSSLGPEHPQSTIRPARREGPTLDVGVIEPPPVPPAQRWLDPPRRPRGALPPPPLGTPLAACPLKRRGAVARDALLRAARATSPQNSGRHRLVAGNSVGMPALAGLRESGAARRLQGISADKPSKEALHRRPIGRTQAKAPQRCKAPQKLLRERRTRVGRSQRACRTPSAPPIAARGRTCPKGPENGLGAGSCVAASARSAIAAPNAPQERRQACTRTPRRRRRSGWTGP